jgi:hypothetical protein
MFERQPVRNDTNCAFFSSPTNQPRKIYSTRLRRRWIRMTSTTTARTAATTRISVTLSIVYSPFLINKIFVKTLHYGDSRGTESHQKKRGKDKQHKREDKFDRCLCRLLLHLLATLGSQRVRMDS